MINIVQKAKNNVFGKLLATFMSGLLTVGQASAAAQSSTQCAVHKTSASSRKITKKQALAISGGVAGAAAVVGGVLYGMYRYIDANTFIDNILEHYLYIDESEFYADDRLNCLDRLVSEDTGVSAEEWFTRLGGTQADVDEYVTQNSSIKSQISSNTDERVKKEFDQIDMDICRTNFCDTESNYAGKSHELLREILKVSILKNDLNQGSKGFIQGLNDICAMVICKFLGEKSKCELETEAKIYYVYNVLANNEFLTPESCMANASDIMSESLKSKCFNKYSFYRTFVSDDKKHLYADGMMAKFWSPFGISVFGDGNHERIIKVWDRIITDDSAYTNCRFDHRKAFVKLFTVINLYVVKYWNEFEFEILNGYNANIWLSIVGTQVGMHLHEIIK